MIIPAFSILKSSRVAHVQFQGNISSKGQTHSQTLNPSEERIANSVLKRIIDGITHTFRSFLNWISSNLKKIFKIQPSEQNVIEWQPISHAGSVVRFQDQHAPINNFYKIDSAFYRGAQPGITGDDRLDTEKLKQGLMYLRDQCGVRTILNLRNDTDLRQEFNNHPKDHQEKEKHAIDQLNVMVSEEKRLKYINIPIRSGSAITEAQFDPIMSVLQKASTSSPIYVHCKAGIDRTGLVNSLYRALKYPNAPFSDVYAEMQSCGHDPNGIWKGYINNLAYFLRTKPLFSEYYQRHQAQIDFNLNRMEA